MGFYYPLFQDVHIMIFIGFGFLMTFVHRYSWSAVGMNFLLSALAVQWSMLTIAFFKAAVKSDWSKLQLDIVHLIDGDFAAGAAMISFGAVLGKVSSTQLVVMVFFEMIIYGMNYACVYLKLQAIDMGGSLVIHTFGAYFGLAVSWVIGQPKNDKTEPRYTKWSSTLSMVGTIFLWCFWPSFNGALSAGGTQHRVIVNTVLSIAGSCIAAFYTSRLLRRDGKGRHQGFDFEELQNATLAGGVAVGSSADLVLRPWGALVVGNVAGILSSLGFIYLTPIINKYLKIHDTCGVNNLHGMPGILGGITGAISAAVAGDSSYGKNIALVFPARAPSDPVAAAALGVEPGLDRSAGVMGGYQAAAIFVSFAFGIGGGILTGYIMKLPIFDPYTEKEAHFDDALEWGVHTDAEPVPGHHSDDEEAALSPASSAVGAKTTKVSSSEVELTSPTTANPTAAASEDSLTVSRAQLESLVEAKVRAALSAGNTATAAATAPVVAPEAAAPATATA